MNIRQFINDLRIIKATSLLADADKSVTEIAFESGFETVRSFNRCFRSHCNCTPSEYKNAFFKK